MVKYRERERVEVNGEKKENPQISKGQMTIVKWNDNNNNNSCLKYFWKLLFLKRIIEDGQEKHKL